MRTSRLLALALTTAVLGSSAGAVHATPSESQRLRGMEGRTFAVTVTGLGEDFQNCYEFRADGTWIDPMVPPGEWSQGRAGASTTYEASTTVPIAEGVEWQLVQQGTVSPAGGKGVLQLHATTTFGLFTLTSVGYEDPDCTLDS